jgi:hypothetical protein
MRGFEHFIWLLRDACSQYSMSHICPPGSSCVRSQSPPLWLIWPYHPYFINHHLRRTASTERSVHANRHVSSPCVYFLGRLLNDRSMITRWHGESVRFGEIVFWNCARAESETGEGWTTCSNRCFGATCQTIPLHLPPRRSCAISIPTPSHSDAFCCLPISRAS